MEIGPDGKPCRACVSVEDMMKKGKEMAEKMKKKGVFHSIESGLEEKSNNKIPEAEEKNPSAPSTSTGAKLHGCPVDKDELGGRKGT